MRIIVTGADGFLGSAVLRKLRTRNDEIVPVTRRSRYGDGFVFCDLSDPLAVAELLNSVKPDCVVNTAALANFNLGVLKDLYPINSLCPAVIADYCQKHKTYLVQASGTIVSGFHNTRYSVNTPETPDTDYGASKLLAERMIKASGCSSALIRFGGIFGLHGPAHLGINRAIQQAQNGIRPKVIASGSAKRNYVFVNDAAAMIEKSINDRLMGVFMAGGQIISIREMLQVICDEWLSGQAPVFETGSESHDQIIDVSPELGGYRSFKDCIRECH